ncbi:hypothetical protein [Paenibacillus sp. UNC451MF]|uniref:hypothetical protein n=1 Tax=Paenibacillus sp. UNC451MF TaxID=1449063 RepID=UPI000B07CD33|nr:hypothetical protein [Paenibacillus sp. UNC451MF]
MNPDKVIAFTGLANQVSKQSYAEIVPGQRHLTILNDTGKLIGPWILKSLAQ